MSETLRNLLRLAAVLEKLQADEVDDPAALAGFLATAPELLEALREAIEVVRGGA